ncbi:hypothetical protein DW352_18155 [Pseudolabrys taiwanensis]|uniref:Uncharacterized protein n=2 Tax=Pseudolabrys taiwanensis TaxID=331696 RepID=A0A345ZZC9_9HYPH|nr:hypothetical protein DW352_18155 [Pseudolabrys taiwanensis]
MRAIVSELDRQGLILEGVPLSGLDKFLISTQLFEMAAFCDVKTRQVSEAVKENLTAPNGKKMVLFIAHNNPLFDDPLWTEIGKRCQIIEEPLVTPSTMSAVMSYFWSTTDMPFGPINPGAFEALLWPLMNWQEEWELNEFWRRLDELLVYFDEVTGTFSDLAISTQASERRAFLRPLRRLVENEERDAIDQFVRSVADRLRQREGRPVDAIADLYRFTRELLSNEASVIRSPESHLLWAVAVLVGGRRLNALLNEAQEDITPHADGLVTAFDLLCRDFHSRQRIRATTNPFADWWEELDAILMNFAECQPRRWLTPEERTVLQLATNLAAIGNGADSPAWVARLGSLVGSAARERRERELARSAA